MEEFRKVKGFENYSVSNLGNIRNDKTKQPKKPTVDTHGYVVIILYKNNKGSKKYIHRLIGESFIDNVDNKPVIDHIDRNKENNTVENLRWATVSENIVNKGISKKNTSTCVGVSYVKRLKKWSATIGYNKSSIFLGNFESFNEAVKIRKENEIKYHKEFKPN